MDSLESKFSSDGSYVSQSSSDVATQQARMNFQRVDQRLCCAVCLDRFRDPRLLECTHSFCRQCLIDLLRKAPKDLDEDEDEKKKEEPELQCPKCRKVTLLGEGGVNALPINYDLKDIVEVMPEDTGSFSPSTPVLAFGRSLAAPPIPICQEHHKHMEYFCKTDDQLVCGDCLVLSRHRGHSTSLAKDELETEMDYLRHHSFEDAEKMLLKVREAVDNVSNMTTSLKEKGERTKLQIQKHFKEIRDALESRELALLSTTEDIVIRKVSKLERQKEVLVQSRDQLDIEVAKLKYILQSKDDYSFLKDKKKLISMVDRVLEIAQSKDRVPVETTKDGPDCFLPHDLLNSAQSFGEVYCQPCPSKFTARGEGLSKGFVGKKAKFKVEARDKYGQRSLVSGTTIKVIVQDPYHTTTLANVEETFRGEYVVTYTPSQVGYHLIKITANETKILNGESHAVVFNKVDYFSLGLPQCHITKSNFRTDPPISTMKSISVLPSGLLVLTDAFCLRVVNPISGQLVKTIGSYGTANGQFSLPHGLATNHLGHIFVADGTNNRIEKFTSEGRHMLTFGSHGQKNGCLSFPEGLTVLGEDRLYVADSGNNRIQIFSQKKGTFQATFGKKGSNAGQFSAPRDLAIDVKNNRLFVSDTGNFRIQALTLDGKPLTQFGNPKGGSVYLRYPYSIAVDQDGFILVTETRLHYITVLTPRGALVRHLGSQGDGPGKFRTPYGICLNPDKGQVIITDSTSHCIQIF